MYDFALAAESAGRRAANLSHPDLGGSAAELERVQKAREALVRHHGGSADGGSS